jgi:hypothetical protein
MDPAAGRAEQISASTAAVMMTKMDVTTKLDLIQNSENFREKRRGRMILNTSMQQGRLCQYQLKMLRGCHQQRTVPLITVSDGFFN